MDNHNSEIPLVPARMVNEYVYCPRLAYLMWVQGEFAHNEYTVDGAIKHRRVDKKTGGLPAQPEEAGEIHARSVLLSSEGLGVTAKIDLVEGEGRLVTPVDYKRGKRPHVAAGVHAPERVQIGIQGLLLQEHGFECKEGIIYFVASKERIRVALDAALVEETREAIAGLRATAAQGEIPPPLADSPKCPRCSLVGICVPDEIAFLNRTATAPRPIFPQADSALPLYVQSPRAYVRKDGERLRVMEEKTEIASARLLDTSQVVLFGSAGVSTPALQECFRRDIPVTFLSYGGWFMGHMVGTGHKNVETRTNQYRASFDDAACLRLARGWIAAKIANCRTLLRRNWKADDGKAPLELLRAMQEDLQRAMRSGSLESLLGSEGVAAARYYREFQKMLRTEDEAALQFDFNGRNHRPPKDPVNALLSFGYAMLAREWTVALAAVGLDPYRGFFHQPRFGRPALALDMMEPFRPLIVDSAVLTAINNEEVHKTDFVSAAGSCTLSESGRKRFIAVYERRLSQEVTHPLFGYQLSYRRLLEVQSRLLIRHLAGEIPRYPNFVTR